MLILEKYEKITTKSPNINFKTKDFREKMFFEKMETAQNREKDKMGI